MEEYNFVLEDILGGMFIIWFLYLIYIGIGHIITMTIEINTKWKHPLIVLKGKIEGRKTPIYKLEQSHIDGYYRIRKYEINKPSIDSSLTFFFPLNLFMGFKKYRDLEYTLCSFTEDELININSLEEEYEKAYLESVTEHNSAMEQKRYKESSINRLNKEFDENYIR